MQIQCDESLVISTYKKLTAKIYRGNPHYRDSLTSVLRLIIAPDGAFAKRTKQEAITVKDDGGEVVSLGLLLLAGEFPAIAQLSFFEALPETEKYVQALVQKSCATAKKWGATSLVVSMNGHVNYGLGFLADHFDVTPSFGTSYTPPYYLDYFRSLGFSEERLVSYRYDVPSFSMDNELKLLNRINHRFSFRQADFSRLQKEIELYTELNNQCFVEHPFYFPRHADEDYELFKPFRWFLREENLLIAELDGRPIGFVLWYPDFNELIRPGHELGLWALLKYKFFKSPIRRFKIAEMGVIPEFQHSGVLLGLFYYCFTLTKGRFKECESGWILDSNLKSKKICQRWQPEPGKNYAVFSLDLA